MAAGRFGPASLEVKSWFYFATAVATVVPCLMFFQHMQNKIVAEAVKEGYTGNPADLTIFDIRFGYTTNEVASTLEAWGDDGRYNYMIIETVDVFIYHSGYRAASLVLLNHLLSAMVARYPKAAPLRPCAQLPIGLAILDFFEDLLQITFTFFFDVFGHVQSPDTPAWYRVVYAASAINQVKWWTVRTGAALAALCVVLLAVDFVRELVVGKGGKRGVSDAKKED